MRKIIFLTMLVIFVLPLIFSADALESEPLVAKNINNEIVLTGIVGQPIIFETTITNNEEDTVDFEIGLHTKNMRDKILDHQMQSIHLESGDATTITYQFTPPVEGNYVSGISYGGIRLIHDHITFPALKDGQTYPTETVLIRSDYAGDCLIACTEPSVLTIDAGTVVEFSNTTPDIRRMSTGSYMEGEGGFRWSSDDRFHSMMFPDRKSSFLFTQPGEYQLSLAEHRSTDVVGTIHVMSEKFREADKTFNILNKIVNYEGYGIPISSLHINPKNSVITVGINDKKNPLFTLDTYKTMIYKQVGNVYLNIVSDHNSFRTDLCDVNDEIAVKAMLDKDPVVQQFLQSYPSATFEHFKTYDEPGNPRTYSEFRDGVFLLRLLVLTYDQNDVCYPVYGYTIGYDSQTSDSKKLFEGLYVKSDGVSKPIDEIKKLSKPYNQIKFGIPVDEIECKQGLVPVLKKSDNSAACVTSQTKSKLVERGFYENFNLSNSWYDNKMSDVDLQTVYDSCANDSPKERIANALRYTNDTHVLLNLGCEWKKIGTFLSK